MQVPGIVVTTFSDLDLSQNMYESLRESFFFDNKAPLWAIIAVDGGSEDDSVKFWESKCPCIGGHRPEYLDLFHKKPEDFKHLSVCLNVGIQYYLWDSRITHIVWVHPDMKFIQKRWCYNLMDYLNANPDVGKVAAAREGVETETVPGNDNPWVMPVEVIKKLIERDGFVFNEKYIGIGGHEDWDLNKRILDLGYKVMICKDSVVNHESMLTRERRDTRLEQIHNAKVYVSRWGTIQPFL